MLFSMWIYEYKCIVLGGRKTVLGSLKLKLQLVVSQ